MGTKIEKAFTSFRIGVPLWINETRFQELMYMFETYKGVTDEVTSLHQKPIHRELMDNRDEITENVRKLFEVRMSLIPYLYSAFADYYYDGIPPFRALVMDYPQDENTYNLDDEYMMGESILIAPIFGNDTRRDVYLPDGNWYCFWTHKKYSGGQKHEIEMPPERIPVFVKEGSLLPIARPIESLRPDTCFEITILAFGSMPFLVKNDTKKL